MIQNCSHTKLGLCPVQNQGVGTQSEGFTLVTGTGHGCACSVTDSAHGAATLQLEWKEFCGKQLYSLGCLGGQSVGMCVCS